MTTIDERFAESFDEKRQERIAGTRNEPVVGPVSDWASDFSHLEPEWAADPYPIQDELRQRCPIAHTDRFGGGWLPTRYEDVAAIAYDTNHFSSRAIIMSNFRPPLDLAPVGGSPPISSDPPFHHDARKLLLPAFTKKEVARLEPSTRAYCHELIDAFGERTDVDAAVEYAQHIPVRIIAEMLGFPQQDAHLFREFVENALEGVNAPPDPAPRSRPPTATRPSSTGPTRSSSTARSTGTPRSAWASTAASAPIWPGWSCGPRSRSGCSASPCSP